MENLSGEMKRLPLYAEREAVQNIKTTPIKRHCAILSHGMSDSIFCENSA